MGRAFNFPEIFGGNSSGRGLSCSEMKQRRVFQQQIEHCQNEKQCSRQLQCEVPCTATVASHICFCLCVGGGVPGGYGGVRGGYGGVRGGRGHFIHLAIYSTTTWCLP